MTNSLIVIGSGVGGLSAAIHAKLKGFDVLVLEKGSQPGGKAAGITIADYNLDPGPSIIIMLRVYQELFQSAGRNIDDYLTFNRLETISRIYFQGTDPLNLPANETECLALLQQLNARDAEQMKTLFGKIESVEPLLWNSVYAHPFDRPHQLLSPALMKFGLALSATTPYKQLVDQTFQLPLLRAFFYGFPSYGGQSYSSKSAGSFLIPYYMMREGVYTVKGGVRAIPQALYKLAQELGIEFRFNAEVKSAETTSNQINAVTLSTGEKLSAHAFIANQDRNTFAQLLGNSPQQLPSYSYFTIHWGIRSNFPDLEHHNLFIPKSFTKGFESLYNQNDFPDEPIVYLNSTKSADPEAAPANASNLFAVVTSPSLKNGQFPVEKARHRVKACLNAFNLDWPEEMQDFERIQSPFYFQSEHNNYHGSLYGTAEQHRLWGMFPPPNRDQKFKNVAYAGGSVQPGAGLPMVILSGKFAAESLAKQS